MKLTFNILKALKNLTKALTKECFHTLRNSSGVSTIKWEC